MAQEPQVQILDSNGKPFRETMPGMKAISGFGRRDSTPYDAASNYSQRMGPWQPFLWSPDGEINIWRDRIVSRVRDLVRNDGWAAGGITRMLDNIIGGNFRPIVKPDWKSLARYSGISAFDHEWAEDYGSALESHWRDWADDTNYYCDAQRCLTISQMMALAFRHKLIDGDCLALMLWQPQNIGVGKSRYATTVQLIDPDRLSNPQLQYDNMWMRGGVKVNHLGAPEAYYIRRAHMGDWFNAGDSMVWDCIERETDWGRPVVVHDYHHDRAGQHRGGVGILTPVLERMKMLAQYDGTELDAAIINAIFAAYIKSPFDPEIVQSALGSAGELNAYQDARGQFHREGAIALGGARIPHLFPGEDIVSVKAERPSGNFEAFEAAMLRNVSAATGLSYPQLSQNWADVNYSSARAAILETWKTFNRQRKDFAVGFAHPIFSCFAEESHDIDNLPLPAGAPEFAECRRAYSECWWIGPGRGWVDPVKERTGAIIGIEAGFSTLEAEAAENGTDWRETIAQRAREIKEFEKYGLPTPSWGHETDEVVQTERIG